MLDIALYILNGFTGAIIYVLIWAKKWEDVTSFESVRHLVVGALAGYVFSIMHTTWNIPNSLMAVVFGYFGGDLIQAIFEKLKPKEIPPPP